MLGKGMVGVLESSWADVLVVLTGKYEDALSAVMKVQLMVVLSDVSSAIYLGDAQVEQ